MPNRSNIRNKHLELDLLLDGLGLLELPEGAVVLGPLSAVVGLRRRSRWRRAPAGAAAGRTAARAARRTAAAAAARRSRCGCRRKLGISNGRTNRRKYLPYVRKEPRQLHITLI